MSSKFKKHPKNNYKKDQIHFLEKEKLEKYLSCPICQEILEEPTRITCGHTFCNKCISQWEKKSHNFQCPLCREYYDPDYSGKDLLAQNMINDANVSCIYKGCPWKDKLVNLNNHIQNCLFNPKKLPKFMKISNWFKDNNKEKENENEQDNKNKTDEEEDNPLANLCSFNYTSSIKERVFSRNPNLVLKLFDKGGNDENIKEKNILKNIEKISDNDEVNEIYNCLILDEDKENNSKNKEKEKEKDKEKENKSENEQGKSLQGSSIMNIFISPNITISQNDFLGNKTERDGK
jgi:hypothetical protein